MNILPNICACMEPQGNDSVCPCAMRRQGLQPHDGWTTEKIEEFKKALSKLYNWKDVNNESNSLEQRYVPFLRQSQSSIKIKEYRV